jgi:sulfur-carrier protein adenylyltransferase/sulfurtransferase
MQSEFSTSELQRYSRHFTLPGVGIEGQRRLRASSVLVVGAGGLGSPVTMYLAAAGVGRLGIVDHDRVDLSNLQRQVVHGTSSTGRPKTESAAARLADINPHVEVVGFSERLSSGNALETLSDWDLVIDGSDNFPTRYLVNDACVLAGKPCVYGSVHRFEGQASVFPAGGRPCYRCLFREPPPPGLVPSCEEAGVFGVLPGLMGMIQATEALKMLLGLGETLAGKLLLVDALRMSFRTIELRPDPDCDACGTRELRELIDYEEFCGMGKSNEERGERKQSITPEELRQLLDSTELLVVDVREPFEHRIAQLQGASLIPLRSLPGSVESIPRDRTIVMMCHHGVRSATAAQFLREQGFENVLNLEGGIDRWSREVDPSVPRY